MINVDGSVITDSTVYGISMLVGLEFDALTLLRVLVTSLAWTALYGFLGNRILKTRDVV